MFRASALRLSCVVRACCFREGEVRRGEPRSHVHAMWCMNTRAGEKDAKKAWEDSKKPAEEPKKEDAAADAAADEGVEEVKEEEEKKDEL